MTVQFRQRTASAAPAGPAEAAVLTRASGRPELRRVRTGRRRTEMVVRSAAHMTVRQPAPWTFFAAGSAHRAAARGSTDAVVGDHCKLRARDHVHVRRLTVAPMPPLPRDALHALARLGDDPDDERAVSRFQQALRPLCRPARDAEPVRVSVHLPPGRPTVVTESSGGVVTDRTHVNAKYGYVVDESVLQLPDLLVRSRDLAKAYADAVADPRRDRAVLARLVSETGRADDRELLAAARGLPTEATTVLALFGVLTTEHATVDDRIRASFTVCGASARRGQVLAGLDAVRRDVRRTGSAAAGALFRRRR